MIAAWKGFAECGGGKERRKKRERDILSCLFPIDLLPHSKSDIQNFLVFRQFLLSFSSKNIYVKFFVFLWSYYPAELRVGLLSWAQFRLRTKNARLFNASANMAPCCLARLEARRRVREGREGGRGERVRGLEALTYQASWGRENLAKRTLEIEKV